MITILTNENNDIFLNPSGNLAMAEDIQALANVCKNVILTTLGEPEYNQLVGIPYFETIFTDTPKIDLFQAAIINTIENLDEIQRVTSFEYSQNNDVFSYSLKAKTNMGDITING